MRPIVAVLLLAACGSPRTEVVLGIATDMPAPGAIDQIKLDIFREGVLAFDIPPWDIPGPGGGQYVLPASFGVYSDDGSEPHIQVVIKGFLKGQQILQRQAEFSLVKEKTLFLRMALVQRCAGMTCANLTDTCIEGTCQPDTVDAAKLKPYTNGLEKTLACSSGTTLLDTSSDMALGPAGTCAPGERCIEGACYLP